MSAKRTFHKRKDNAVAVKEDGRFITTIPSAKSQMAPEPAPINPKAVSSVPSETNDYSGQVEHYKDAILESETSGKPLRDTVAICMVDESGRWLQIRRAYNNKGGGKVGFAAGKVEEGESQAEAVRREAMEELGIEVSPVACFTVIDLPEWNVRMHAWIVESYVGDFNPGEREVAEILWLTRDEIASHPDALRSSALIAAELPL